MDHSIWISISSVVILLAVHATFAATSPPQVPCFFVFGDSLVDNGNNNNLNTLNKVNYPPYGIDFPGGPTGRFSNGRTAVDFISQSLGFDNFIPPFATAKGSKEVLKGVNYGSGGAGIRTETGQDMGERIYLQKQVDNHRTVVSQISQLLGNVSARQHLNKCIYYFAIGNNDYINNYFKPQYYNSSKVYKPDKFADVLIAQLSQQLVKMYGLGARKVAISSLGDVGCCPAQAQKDDKGGSSCSAPVNDAVKLFDDRLSGLVDDLHHRFRDAKFLIAEVRPSKSPTILLPGAKLVNETCCKVSKTTGLCMKGQPPCSGRTHHIYFDNFHPSEAITKFAANSIYQQMRQLI